MSDYLRVLRREIWVILLTAGLVTGLAVGLSMAQRELYEAQADVFLSGARQIPSDLVDDPRFLNDPERASNTQASLARVPAVARRALRKSGVSNRTAEDLLDNSSVSNPLGTDILRFSVTDESQALATRLASAYATAYTEYRRQLDTRSLVAARRQVERRLAALEGEGRSGDIRQLRREEQQLRTAEALQGSNVGVVAPATEAVKTQPKPVRNGVLGAILGLVLGMALAFVRRAMNARVVSADEVQERLGLPLIGQIPRPRRHARGATGVSMLEAPYAPETEAYRMLATNLGFVNLDRGARSIMVTSATDGEGKSTTIANLAVALARTGNHVTLVDFDLMRPSLDGLFNLDAAQFGIGMTGVALGRMTLEDALIRISLEHDDAGGSGVRIPEPTGTLDLLLTGAIPPDTAEFISSPRVSEILWQLTERSDIVLVDVPPVPQASDAIALAGKVDAVVVVTKLSAVRRHTLDVLRRMLDSAPVVKLGVVLTGVRATDGYGYRGPYGGALTNGTRSQSRPRAKVT